VHGRRRQLRLKKRARLIQRRVNRTLLDYIAPLTISRHLNVLVRREAAVSLHIPARLDRTLAQQIQVVVLVGEAAVVALASLVPSARHLVRSSSV